MIFKLTSRLYQEVYPYAIRSSIWSAVILEKSWKIIFFDPPKHHENMLKMGFSKVINKNIYIYIYI